jgi:energy-coupling factor transporter ATP-binding protein EcfA2
MAGLPSYLLPPTANLYFGLSLDINNFVLELRKRVSDSIQERCGTMRILDMTQPIELNDIYTNVNILEKIPGRLRKEIDELLQELSLENFERFGQGRIATKGIGGLEAVEKYKKLLILGKPGSGKTTFLKYLAIQCDREKFQPQRVPIFVTLKDFAEMPRHPTLLEYIGISHDILPNSPRADSQLIAPLDEVFHHGSALILLDGLDEVRKEDNERVLKEIREFAKHFYKNYFVVTCRIAAREYTLDTFDTFTEVEIADFTTTQIETFAANWFRHKSSNQEISRKYLKSFLKSLDRDKPIQELASNPLLLTLLCLTFEDSMRFPPTRWELYKEGLEALLKKWDAKRGIERDYPTDLLPQGELSSSIYQELSVERKRDLLCQIALNTFKQKKFLFQPDVLEEYITTYISNSSNIEIDPESLQLNCEAILHSIEAQHGLIVERAKGIYSFSHLTFHEYFAAREIVIGSQRVDEELPILVEQVFDKRWREVFLLATEMLRDASRLLFPMKQKIDALLTDRGNLQKFLSYASDRAASPVLSFCKPSAARAFYFDIDFDIDGERRVALLLDKSVNLLVCASFWSRILKDMSWEQAIAMAQQYDADRASDPSHQIAMAPSANDAMLIAIQVALESQKLETTQRQNLDRIVHKHDQKLEHIDEEEEIEQVASEARATAKKRSHLGREWKFSDDEKILLKKYYDANLLLLECINSKGCKLKLKDQQKLEETLLLPMDKI